MNATDTLNDIEDQESLRIANLTPEQLQHEHAAAERDIANLGGICQHLRAYVAAGEDDERDRYKRQLIEWEALLALTLRRRERLEAARTQSLETTCAICGAPAIRNKSRLCVVCATEIGVITG